jgi:ribonuclease HI
MAETLNIFCDGGARGNPGPAAIGVVILGEQGNILTRIGTGIGETTNNIAEYQAVIAALTYIKDYKLQAKKIVVHLDSLLVAQQLNGLFKVKKNSLRELMLTVRTLESEISGEIYYRHIPRVQNARADAIVNHVLDQA